MAEFSPDNLIFHLDGDTITDQIRGRNFSSSYPASTSLLPAANMFSFGAGSGYGTSIAATEMRVCGTQGIYPTPSGRMSMMMSFWASGLAPRTILSVGYGRTQLAERWNVIGFQTGSSVGSGIRPQVVCSGTVFSPATYDERWPVSGEVQVVIYSWFVGNWLCMDMSLNGSGWLGGSIPLASGYSETGWSWGSGLASQNAVLGIRVEQPDASFRAVQGFRDIKLWLESPKPDLPDLRALLTHRHEQWFELSVRGISPVSGVVPCFISGPRPADSSAPFFLKVPEPFAGSVAMHTVGPLQSTYTATLYASGSPPPYFPFEDDAVFYHKAEPGLAEFIQTSGWYSYGALAFTSGVIGRAIYSANQSYLTCFGYSQPKYRVPSEPLTSWTAAFWMSGAMLANNEMFVGWGMSSLVLFGNGLGLRVVNANGDLEPYVYYANGQKTCRRILNAQPDDPLTPKVSHGDRTFVVMHVEFAQRDASYIGDLYVSLDGKPFIRVNASPDTLASLPAIGGSTLNVGFALKQGTGGKSSMDEVMLWQNAPKMESIQLEQLHALGATSGLGMDWYARTFGTQIPVAASMPLYIGTINFASAPLVAPRAHQTANWACSLFTKAARFPGDDYCVYIHHFDSFSQRTDAKYGQTWSPQMDFGFAYTSGNLAGTSLIQKDNVLDSDYLIGYSGPFAGPGKIYPFASGDSWTFSVWTSGLYHRPDTYTKGDTVELGWTNWIDAPPYPLRDGLQIERTDANHVVARFRVSGLFVMSGVVDAPYDNDWHLWLFDFRMDRANQSAHVFYSVDGGQVQVLVSGLLGEFPAAPNWSSPVFNARRVYDETWQDIPRLGVDEAVMWQGREPITTDEARVLYRLGQSGAILEEYVRYDYRLASNSCPLFMSGPAEASEWTALFVAGPVVASGDISMHVSGPRPASGIASVFLRGPEPTVGSFPLHLEERHGVGSISLVIWDHHIVGSFPMFMGTRDAQTFKAFVCVEDSLTSGRGNECPLFVRGRQLGAPQNTRQVAEISLFVDGGVGVSAILRQVTGFASAVAEEVPTSGLASYQGTFFVRCDDNCAAGSTWLSMTGRDASQSPWPPVSGDLTLFISHRLGDTFSLDHGFPAFAKVTPFAWAWFGMAMSGWAYPCASGDTRLWVAGGYKASSGDCFLHLDGLGGLCSGSMTLYYKVGSSARNWTMDLYTHGF